MIYSGHNPETVHEAVGVFSNTDSLQSAMEDLQQNGFMQQELSVLAGDRVVRKKLGRSYVTVHAAKDDPAAPRTVFISNGSRREAQGVVIGLPLYLAAAIATAICVAYDSSLLKTIIVATLAGIAGAAMGGVIAYLISKHHSNYIQAQMDQGGLLLWVHLRRPGQEQMAKSIMLKHAAHDVNVHEILLN